MPQAFLINPVARLHLYAMEHARTFIAAAMVLAGVGRLMFVNPPLAVAAIVFVAMAMWHSSLPRATRLSNRHLALTALALFVVTSLVFAGVADAQSNGSTLGSMATSLKNDMGSIYSMIVYAFYGGGLVSTGVGVNNGIKKSKGDQQVSTGSIFGYGLGGPALGMVGYVMNSAAGSMGAGSSAMDALPTAAH
jgi:hypothetical protein